MQHSTDTQPECVFWAGLPPADPLFAGGSLSTVIRAAHAIIQWQEYDDILDREAMNPTSDAVPRLVAALDDEHDGVRRVAAKTLGKIGDAAAVPALLGVLHDRNHLVRRHAIDSLAKIGDTAAIPGLIALLSDDERAIRLAAIEALATIGDATAMPALRQASRDSDRLISCRAVQLLQRFEGDDCI